MASDPHVRLEDLITAVELATPDGDELDRIAEAAQLKDDVDALTDALVGHFVEAAREAGCSWSQIGEALGVSKQAAQQKQRERARVPDEKPPRWRGRMFTRFTERTKTSIDRAHDAARDLGHNYIGTEHLLLGILRTPECVAAVALADLGVSVASVEQAVLEIIGRGGAAGGRRPFTPRAKRALELSLKEALQLGHNYVGTEHLLIALLRMEEGVAEQVLREHDVTTDKARTAVIRILTGGR